MLSNILNMQRLRKYVSTLSGAVVASKNFCQSWRDLITLAFRVAGFRSEVRQRRA